MDRYFKRTRSSAGKESALSKRARVEWGAAGDPQSICVWNCNGLSVRLASSSDRNEFISFVKEHRPEVICLSEVRCAARCDDPDAKRNDGAKRYRGEFKDATPKDPNSDGVLVRKLLQEPELVDYTAYFSLADWKVRKSRVAP
jgi:exonuclease III